MKKIANVEWIKILHNWLPTYFPAIENSKYYYDIGNSKAKSKPILCIKWDIIMSDSIELT